MNSEIASNAAMVLSKICRCDLVMTPQEIQMAGKTARRLFRLAINQDLFWLLQRSIECVSRTFESDPSESGQLIRSLLAGDRMKDRAHEELKWLSWQIKTFIKVDPKLARDIYKSAFGFKETSDEITSVADSGAGILSLTSNRRQDYDSILFGLNQEFGLFLNESPEIATVTLGFVIDRSFNRYGNDFEPDKELSFEFLGNQVVLWPDYSGSFDRGMSGPPKNHIDMLSAFQEKIESFAEDDLALAKKIIELLTLNARKAIVWKRLLESGSRKPKTIGRILAPLLWKPEILSCSDTNQAASELLGNIFHQLDDQSKEKVEAGILNLSNCEYFVSREYAERIQKRVIRPMKLAAIKSDDLKILRKSIDQEINNQPEAQDIQHPFDFEDDWRRESLRRQNIDPDEAGIKSIHDAENPIREFNSKHLSAPSELEDVENILPDLLKLRQTIEMNKSNVPQGVCDNAMEALHEACVKLSYCITELQDIEELASFVNQELLDAATMSSPVFDPKEEQNASQYPSGIVRGARCKAAVGLINLEFSNRNSDRLMAIMALSEDRTSAVRAVVSWHVSNLSKTGETEMWSMIEKYVENENHLTVLISLVSGSLTNLRKHNSDKVSALATRVWKKELGLENPKALESLKARCTQLLRFVYLDSPADDARESIIEIASAPSSFLVEANSLANQLRSEYAYGEIGDEKGDDVRRKAFEIAELLLKNSISDCEKLLAKFDNKPSDEIPDHDKERYRALAKIQDGITQQMFFGSGAYALKNQFSNDSPPPLYQRERFWREASNCFQLMTKLSHAHAIYSYVKTLESFIEHAPKVVLLLICKTVESGKRANFQFDSLAVKQIVAIVSRYLASYANLCREDGEVRNALIEVLETFASARWPAANRLLFRMNDIYK